MNWEEFVQKLKDAKKQKKNKGLSVPVITSLIFSGAFDDMIGEFDGPKFKVYLSMHEEVKKALASKAVLPTKKKDDIISLHDINSDAHIQIWRHQVDPTKSFTFVDGCLKNMQLIGYERVNSGSIEAIKKHTDDNGNVTHESIVVGNWNNLPDDDHPVMKDLLAGRRNLGAVGVITDIKKHSYKTYNNEEREMIKFEIFNGYGYIKDLIMWPDRKTGKINEFFKENMKKGKLGIIDVAVGINQKTGKRSYSIQHWHGFMDA